MPSRRWASAVFTFLALIAIASTAMVEVGSFAPLGITTFEWAEGRDGVASAASGLRLRPLNLLRIGQLALVAGTRDDKRIVSRAWLDASFTPAVTAIRRSR